MNKFDLRHDSRNGSALSSSAITVTKT